MKPVPEAFRDSLARARQIRDQSPSFLSRGWSNLVLDATRDETRAALVSLLGATSWLDYKERRRAMKAARRTEGVLFARWGVA